MNSESPVLLADIGDGKQRRFFLGADELRVIKREVGRGWWTLYKYFGEDAEPDEVAAVLRLALIGGGETPKTAAEIVQYYAYPPRPLKEAYLLAYEVLNAAFNGPQQKKGAKQASDKDMDDFFVVLEAALLKGGKDLSALRGKSFAELQELFAAINEGGDKPAAPSADVFNAIKATATKGQ